jgi:predicted Zn-dependent peptidase
VQKEQGIIGQEIRMYDDEPQWRVMFNLLQAMYKNHPVRIDIAGTEQSIAEIDHELLYKCYRTFYNPANMFICIAGNVDADAVFAQIEAAVKSGDGRAIERSAHEEPAGVQKPYVEQQLSVSQPMFCMGFKERCDRPLTTLRERLESNILLDIIAGECSPLFGRLLDEGLIGEELGTEFFNGYGYAATLFDGESRDPAAVRDALLAEIERLRREGVDEQDFIRSKNGLYGQTIMQYNNVEQIGSALVGAVMGDYDLFSVADEIAAITPADIERRLRETMDAERFAMSVILPK